MKKTILIAFIMLLISLCSCGCAFKEYSGDYPDLYAVAINSVLWVNGYSWGADFECDPQIEKIDEDNYGRTKRGTVKETISNDFFEKRFGRNDFEEIFMAANGKDAGKYCLKYMRKTNSRAIYGRGIPTEYERTLDITYAAFCTLPTWKNGVIVDGIERHILFDSLAKILFGDYTNVRMVS